MTHCNQCCRPIFDRYLMRINDQSYHERCLMCCMCGIRLIHSCFSRDSKLFCRDDYERLFIKKCLGCSERINPEELVMRTIDHIFHLNCFICVVCGIRLQKGDQYVIKQGQLFCRSDYEKEVEMLQGFQQSGEYFADDYMNGSSRSHDGRRGPKRPRTILTTQQRRAFKASFEVSPKPCRKVRETLAKETGLSVRIVQVWFQNQRAKVKKIEKKARQDPHGKNVSLNNYDNDDDDKSPKSKSKDDDKSPSAASSLLNDSCSDTDLPIKNQDSFNEIEDSESSQSRKFFSIKKEIENDDFFRETRNYFNGFVANSFASRFDLNTNDSATTSAYLTNIPPSQSSNTTNNHGLNLSLNPIDRLYSMQSSYFCADDPSRSTTNNLLD